MLEAEQSTIEHWTNTISSRFRDGTDIVPIGYATNYALKNNMAYLTNKKPLKLLHHYDNTYKYKKKHKKYDVICINKTNDIFNSIKNLRDSIL